MMMFKGRNLTAFSIRILIEVEKNPNISFDALSASTNVPKLLVNEEIQRLYKIGFLTSDDGELFLTDDGQQVTGHFAGWDAVQRRQNEFAMEQKDFDWQETYIPRKFELPRSSG